MNSFKVGDKVKRIAGKYKGMETGDVDKIIDTSEGRFNMLYLKKFGDGHDMKNFKKVDKNKMTKKDLKTGMILELENGQKAQVLLDTRNGDIFSSRNRWAPLSEINDDLTSSTKGCEVVKIYQPKYNAEFSEDMWDHAKLIWERDTHVELTLKQIADEFGISVENLRIKDSHYEV